MFLVSRRGCRQRAGRGRRGLRRHISSDFSRSRAKFVKKSDQLTASLSLLWRGVVVGGWGFPGGGRKSGLKSPAVCWVV